jgi:hypothetical protein
LVVDSSERGFRLADSRNVLEVQFWHRLYPDASDFWDGNWLRASVRVRAGSFQGKYQASIRTDEIEDFRRELKAAYEDLKGPASLETLEHQLTIQLDGDGIGHFKARCEAVDGVTFGNRLSFEVETDQTYIPDVLAQLEAVLSAFPVINR